MEPNKLENQIQEKLNAREIKPSAQAWDRLDAMLSISENRKPKNRFNWLYIAASIIGFVFVGLLFYNQESTNLKTINQTVVEVDEVEKQNSKISNVVEALNVVDCLNKNDKLNSYNQIINNKDNLNNTKNEYKAKHQLITNSEKSIINEEVSIINQNQIVENQKEEITKQSIVKQQIALVSDEDLLIFVKPKVTTKSSFKFNSTSLLSEVDEEINTEFRESVFTKVAKNFQTVRVALAERNNIK